MAEMTNTGDANEALDDGIPRSSVLVAALRREIAANVVTGNGCAFPMFI
ncbi:MAG TPA: hypothetical protein VFW60_01300 [Rhodanobacteraceae bacterium]|jgi:hypothetical protein|nr:hypothetical protein [Rhodanobacteraceae bacterium]